ncbi:hypothetical protein EUGRSUZ_K00057 [Eucalyptus grandis]|uniref:Uncharacterized protein n=2 Tax=Eucalyptus grandis TaxID=71139 RepID=A0ACC3IQQ4_EUCGR|nr:hypothetical protein EUGRSUZ_K00057 [Eucalyptus grandis]
MMIASLHLFCALRMLPNCIKNPRIRWFRCFWTSCLLVAEYSCPSAPLYKLIEAVQVQNFLANAKFKPHHRHQESLETHS